MRALPYVINTYIYISIIYLSMKLLDVWIRYEVKIMGGDECEEMVGMVGKCGNLYN
jgi:hypothetical protein